MTLFHASFGKKVGLYRIITAPLKNSPYLKVNDIIFIDEWGGIYIINKENVEKYIYEKSHYIDIKIARVIIKEIEEYPPPIIVNNERVEFSEHAAHIGNFTISKNKIKQLYDRLYNC